MAKKCSLHGKRIETFYLPGGKPVKRCPECDRVARMENHQKRNGKNRWIDSGREWDIISFPPFLFLA